MNLSTDNPVDEQYPNQPLAEVACELRFAGEPVIEGRRYEFFEHVRHNFPKVLVPQAIVGTAPSLQHHRYVREDQSAGVSLAINSIAYFEHDYSGSTHFISRFCELTQLANRLFTLRSLRRLGWRYINGIPFSRENGLIPLHRYFKDPPKLFAIPSSEHKSISFTATTTLEDLEIRAKLESAASVEQSDEILTFDIDVFFETDNLPRIEDPKFEELVIRLHNVARNFFEDSISEGYRSFLRGESYE